MHTRCFNKHGDPVEGYIVVPRKDRPLAIAISQGILALRMDSDQTLIDARNEALRKIGRNVVLFQELEGILKFLVLSRRSSAGVSRLRADRDNRAAAVREHTLGQLNRHLLENLYSPSNAESSAPDHITEPWLTFTFQIEADAESVERSKASLASLVTERNELIHGLLARWNLHDAGICQTLCVELDAQRSRIILEIEKYRAYANGLKELATEYQAFIDSEEGKKHFDLICLQQSRLVATLASVAMEHTREDGWTLLSIAGNHLSQLMPNDFARLKTEHGEGSLHKLVVATDLFDVRTEQTSNGGTRALYRLRAEEDA